jgi:quercetin dioxygenase-like cupin family protein
MKTDHQEKSQTGREHEVGSLSAPLLNFDLNREIQQLRSEGRWQSDHTAKTLVKYSGFRIVLVAIRAGGRLVQHRTEGQISVHNLVGHIRLHSPEQAVELPAGHMLAIERDIPHDVEASVDSAFLLTIAWPSSSRRFRELGLDKTLADTFPCSDALSTIPNPELGVAEPPATRRDVR